MIILILEELEFLKQKIINYIKKVEVEMPFLL